MPELIQSTVAIGSIDDGAIIQLRVDQIYAIQAQQCDSAGQWSVEVSLSNGKSVNLTTHRETVAVLVRVMNEGLRRG
jgi:hypothetical protein